MVMRYSTAPDGTDARPWIIWDNQPDNGHRYDRYQDEDGKYPEFSSREKALELVDRLNGGVQW